SNPEVQALADGATATDSLTYTNSDNHGGSSSTSLDITITGTNDAPVAVADTSSVTEDTPPNPVGGNVLTNDTDVDVGDSHTVTAVNGVGANVGVVVAETYGTLHLIPSFPTRRSSDLSNPAVQALADGATATDSFTYT